MNTLLEKSEQLIKREQSSFARYLNKQINWSNRLIGIKGSRGTGKTTLMLQKLKSLKKQSNEAAYFSLDDLYFTTNSLVETAETFHKKGGQYLFLDEVHKYPGWAKHIKNLYDFNPDLTIVFTGSSIIDIAKEEADLSRRARMYELQGLSFREYLAYIEVLDLNPFDLDEILSEKSNWKETFPGNFKPMKYFETYLARGYYPFFKEDETGYHDRLSQLTRLIVEYDMAELKDFDIRNAKKMLQLLYILSANVPFKPNLSTLANKSNIHRNSVSNYLYYLEEARLIKLLYHSGISVAILQKPEKIYLDNTNLSFAISPGMPEKGNLRETFFLNQLSNSHSVRYPSHGDFVVNEKWTFEVGGKDKQDTQIRTIKNSFVVRDDVPFPATGLPLWLFGFLY